MRESDWQIRWNPLGSTPRVLLNFGDLMMGEISRPSDGTVDVGRFDFAPGGVVVSRKNARRRLEFSRIDDHATNAQAWEKCGEEILAAPWGAKGLISVRPRGGTEKLYFAAVESSEHGPSNEGPKGRSEHEWSFRITPYSMVPSGPGGTITGGWFNPPTGGVGGTPGGVTVIVPPGHGIPPGGVVLVTGLPGVVNGYYPVRGVTPGSGGAGPGGGDQVTIDIPDHNQPTFDTGGSTSLVFRSAFETSPNPPIPTYLAFIQAKVLITTEVPIEIYRRDIGTGAFGWFGYPGGNTYGLSSPLYAEERWSRGSWDGLDEDSPSQTVGFESVFAVFRWRRVGAGTVNEVSTPIVGSGTVTWDPNVASTHSFEMPTVSVHVTAFGAVGGTVGTFEGGGSITPVEPG